MTEQAIAVNIDEIGSNVADVLAFLQRNRIRLIELRMIDGVNIANFVGSRVHDLKSEIDAAGLSVCAIASPLFKWHRTRPVCEQAYDSFGFASVLTEEEKRQTISRVILYAGMLDCRKIRIFSGLHGGTPDVATVIADSWFAEAVADARSAGISLLLENEPACHVFTMDDVTNTLAALPGLDFWIDPANFFQAGEVLTAERLRAFLPRIGHVHLKDFIRTGSGVRYAPLGSGELPWTEILRILFEEGSSDISYSVETHVPGEGKMRDTEESIRFFRATAAALHAGA
jgi:sugar phosphate isomerase/epimerase